MAELATLARPYANAVFELARDAGQLAQWSRMLSFLAAASRAPEVRELIASPGISREQKAHRLCEICADELNDAARRFVHVLAANGRLSLLQEIADQFEVRKAEAEQTLDVEITSAVTLSDEELSRLASALKSRFDQEINLTTRVDADLIGGAVVRAGDTVIDGSVRGKLSKLSEALQRT